MRTFIFILMLMFTWPGAARAGNFYGDHKNDQCGSEPASHPYYEEPNQCFWEENKGCCVWTFESLSWDETWCYEYHGPDRCLWDIIKIVPR